MIKERNNLGATASMCISLTHGRALGAGVIRDAEPVQRVEWTQRRRRCHNQPRIRVLHTRRRDSGQTMGKHYQGSTGLFLMDEKLQTALRANQIIVQVLKFTCWGSSLPTFWSCGITLNIMLKNESVRAIRKFGSKLLVTMQKCVKLIPKSNQCHCQALEKVSMGRVMMLWQ